MVIDSKHILRRQKIGLWVMEFEDGKPARLFTDDVMSDLMGIEGDMTPEQTYEFWKRGTDEVSAGIMENVSDQMFTGEYAEAQYIWNHPDGTKRTVRCGGSRDFSCTDFIRLLGSHRDITSVIHIDEEQINRDRNIINRYLETAKYALIVNLVKGTYATIKTNPENDAVIRFAQKGLYSDLIRSYIRTFVNAPNVRSMMEVADADSLAARMISEETVEITFKKKIYSYCRWYRFKANKLSADEVLITFHDVDKEVQSKQFWNAMSSRMICGFMIDLKANSATFIKRSALLSSYTRFEHTSVERIASVAASMIDEEYREEWIRFCNIEKMRAIARESRRADFSFTTHVTGSLMWVRAVLDPLVDVEGGATIALSVYRYTKESLEKMKRDEEYRKALEAVSFAQEANRLKTTFVQNISHDIRTPLNAIVGFSQLLSMPDGFLDETEKSQYADYIKDSAELLTMIINDVLSMSDVEMGILNISIGRSLCNEICRKSVNCSNMRTPAGVRMYYTSEVGDDFMIETDAMRVQQILVNFLSNACKHTSEGEIHVHCSLSENPGSVTFSVTDTGEGVPDSIADGLFDRFTTLDVSKGGHGMGLNICRDVAQRLGGYVGYDASWRRGARFFLVIPQNSI